jgi:endonuclease YncB( thermonuclease family)
MRFLFLVSIAVGLFSYASPSNLIVGRPRIVDGDTLALGAQRIRLHGIDAPEQQQSCVLANREGWACGSAATGLLKQLAENLTVSCAPRATDRFGRTVAVCQAAGRDLGGALVEQGLAQAYTAYAQDYVAAEAAARADGRGIWDSIFTSAQAYRKRQRAARLNVASADDQPATAGCLIKGNVSAKGRIYHVPGSRHYARTAMTPSRGDVWFCTTAQAIAAGWRAPRG